MDHKHLPQILLSAGFLLLLLACARGDLWLDEVWSINMATAAASPLEIVTRFRHDNNHVLNTLYLYWVGPGHAALVYRVPALVAGCVALFLVVRIAARLWQPPAALIALVLVGTCYPLLLYFSEARGYAMALAAGLAAYAALLDTPLAPSPRRVALYWLVAAVGVLAHPSVILVVAALTLRSLLAGWIARQPVRRVLARCATLHAPPLVGFVAWYFVFYHGARIGGGPVYATDVVFNDAAMWLLGLPAAVAGSGAAAFIAVLLALAGLCSLWRHKPAEAGFFATLILLPPVLLLVWRPQYLYFRYFLVVFPFYLLLLARLFAAAGALVPRARRLLPWLLVASFVAGHLPRDARLLALGRGQYRIALETIRANTPGATATVGSDHDFRIGTMVLYHVRTSPQFATIAYIPVTQFTSAPPLWLLTHESVTEPHADAVVSIPGVGRYAWLRAFPAAAISGMTWHLYRRDAR